MSWNYTCTACGEEWEFKNKVHGNGDGTEVDCTCGGPLLLTRTYEEHKVKDGSGSKTVYK